MGQGMMIDNDGYLMPDYEDDDSDMEEKYVTNLKEKQIPKLKSVVCFEFLPRLEKRILIIYYYIVTLVMMSQRFGTIEVMIIRARKVQAAVLITRSERRKEVVVQRPLR
jgi:hypothetical protein